MAGGIALFDADGDGRLDIFLTNGAPQPSLVKSGAEWHNRLYRNLGAWRFEDITARAGLEGRGFDMGPAAADYDNDGDTDLFVAGVHSNSLYRNEGGVFKDVTAAAGLDEPKKTKGARWSVAAGWFDYNNDRNLDLLVIRYVQWDPSKEPYCGDPAKTYRTYCHPKNYTGLPNSLFRNNGNGTFTDVSEASGIAAHIGKGMSVSFADYDLDGDVDAVVTNDTVPNFLFRNEGNGTFSQVALPAGIAFNDDGRALSSMGVDFRDVDNDGLPDVFITALINETYPLYRNLDRKLFSDITYPSLIGAATMQWSGWGTGIYDFDNDGSKDLFAANGDVQDNSEQYSNRRSKQPLLVLTNSGKGTFTPSVFGDPALHRGAAFGDLDNNGTVDAVVARIGQRPAVLDNQAPVAANAWVGFELTGTRSSRDPIGARVRIQAKNVTQWNHVTTSVGYAGSSDRRVHFGLGPRPSTVEAEILWPSGTIQKLTLSEFNRYIKVVEPER